MARLKDPRGILTFIFRYLVLHVVFLLGLPVSRNADLALFYFFGFMGFFTFFQVLASISQKFLDHGGAWKAVVIMGAIAAIFAWGLREIIHAVKTGGTTEPRNPNGPVDPRASADPSGPVDPRASASPGGSEDAEAPRGDPTNTDPSADDR